MRFLAVLLCFLATPALSGAWMRAKGGWFSDVSSNWSTSDVGTSFSTTFFGEYGLTDRLTVGLDGYVTQTGAITALYFTRTPLWSNPNGHRLALEIAGGTSAGWAVLRPGLSYGRGISSGWGPGWFAVDASATVNLGTGAVTYKVDSTVGITPSDRWKAILKFHTALPSDGGGSVRIAPSVVMRVGRMFQFEAGLNTTLWGPRQTGLKLGIWTEF
ncbi:hypothetical protein [Thalassovita sp.]|uniref:hypothetical protein n=1 Tax=Thalassovita sp. TaxID=1979401 RepID=UPI002882100E|nr:hypothetical protein [Thalassovita sp.]MDF1803227.1 hypothetical protein [Thalassovita sp.]